jgi:hypothetical protein
VVAVAVEPPEERKIEEVDREVQAVAFSMFLE